MMFVRRREMARIRGRRITGEFVHGSKYQQKTRTRALAGAFGELRCVSRCSRSRIALPRQRGQWRDAAANRRGRHAGRCAFGVHPFRVFPVLSGFLSREPRQLEVLMNATLHSAFVFVLALGTSSAATQAADTA